MRWAVAAGLAPPPLCRWVERWVAGLQQPQLPTQQEQWQQQQLPAAGSSHELAKAAVAAAACYDDESAAAAAAGGGRDTAAAEGAAVVRGGAADGIVSRRSGAVEEFGGGMSGCGLYLMPIPPELLLPGPAAAAVADAPKPGASAESSPAAEAPGTAATASTPQRQLAAAPAGDTRQQEPPQQAGPALQLVGPIAVAEGLLSRTASTSTSAAAMSWQAQVPSQASQCNVQSTQRAHVMAAAVAAAGPGGVGPTSARNRLGRDGETGGSACGGRFGCRRMHLHSGHKARVKPKRLPHETAARLFVAGGKLLP